jgi:HK97 family phage portal protein
MKEDSARSETPIKKHPVAKLFVRPNAWQTWTEWCRQMHAAYLLRGNAYAVILRDGRGNPISLIPVNPDSVSHFETPDGYIFYCVSRGSTFLNAILRDTPLMIPEDDVFHLRNLGFNMLVGLSLISIARDSFGVALGLEQQAARFMANGARPSGVLQTDKQLSKDAADRLRTQWEQLRSGIQNAGRTAILEEGLKWSAMQLSSVDLEFIAQRQFSVSDVARWFDMPLYKLGVPGEIARIKFDDADQAYVNTTIMPDLDAWEQKFVQKFELDKEGLVADFDERRLLRAAEATRINNQRLKIMSGISTQNECRAENGDPPLEGGDVLLTPVNLASSGSDMSGTAADGAGRPNDGTLPDPGAANDTKD